MLWNLATTPPKKTNQYLVCIRYYDGEEPNGEILYCDVAFFVEGNGKWMMKDPPKGAQVTHWVPIPDWPG